MKSQLIRQNKIFFTKDELINKKLVKDAKTVSKMVAAGKIEVLNIGVHFVANATSSIQDGELFSISTKYYSIL